MTKWKKKLQNIQQNSGARLARFRPNYDVPWNKLINQWGRLRPECLNWRLSWAAALTHLPLWSRCQREEKRTGHTERSMRGLGGGIAALQYSHHGSKGRSWTWSRFVAHLLEEALNLEKTPTINRAHYTLRSKPRQDSLPPQAFVVKCHYFSLLKKAMEMKSVTTADGDHIWILPDYTHTVSKQWASLTEVRGLLRGSEGVCYGLRNPTILRITTADGKEASFKYPKLAMDFVWKRVMHEVARGLPNPSTWKTRISLLSVHAQKEVNVQSSNLLLWESNCVLDWVNFCFLC